MRWIYLILPLCNAYLSDHNLHTSRNYIIKKINFPEIHTPTIDTPINTIIHNKNELNLSLYKKNYIYCKKSFIRINKIRNLISFIILLLFFKFKKNSLVILGISNYFLSEEFKKLFKYNFYMQL